MIQIGSSLKEMRRPYGLHLDHFIKQVNYDRMI